MPRRCVAARKLVLACAALLAVAAGAPSAGDPGIRRALPAGPPPSALPEHAPREILVKFRPDAAKAARGAVRAELTASVVRVLPRIDVEQWRLRELDTAEALKRLRGHPALLWSEPNHRVRLCETPDDPDFVHQWGLRNTGQEGGSAGADVRAVHAWDVFTGADGVLVAVIDSGVDADHPDLAAAIHVNPGEIPDNGLDDDGNGYVDDVHGWNTFGSTPDTRDDDGHGTVIAGIIGARGDNGRGVAGIGWRIRILPVKWTAGITGDIADLAAAVMYAVDAGADVLSCSFGYGAESETLRLAFEAAGAAGILAACAAGNLGQDIDGGAPFYPASFDLPNIVAVAATGPDDVLASFSNRGAVSIDLAAPGVRIWSTEPGGGYGLYRDYPGGSYGSGTSFAAPFAAGVLALILDQDPQLSPAAARDRLLAAVDPLPGLAGLVATGGRLNAFLALAEPDPLPPAAVDDLAVGTVASTRIELTWTASGDDGRDGTASAYEIRYAAFPLDGGFEEGLLVTAPPDPQPAGERESLTVDGLAPGTTYHFALRVLDEWGAYGEPANASPVSASVSARTLGAPVLAVSPDALAAALVQGGSTTLALTVTNAGAGVLDVALAPSPGDDWIAVAPVAVSVPAGEAAEVLVRLDAPGPGCGERSGELRLLCNDSALPELVVPVRLWVDGPPVLVLPAQPVALPDAVPGQIVLGALEVANTGCLPLVLDGFLTDHSAFFLPEPGGITVPPGETGTVVLGFRPPRRGAIAGTLGFATGDPARPYATVELAGTGVAAPVLAPAPPALAAATFTGGAVVRTLFVRNPGGYPLDFTVEVAVGAGWLSARPAAGTVQPGDSLAVRATLRAGGLCDTTLVGELLLHGAAPADTTVAVPATLAVTGAANLVLEPFEIDFGPAPVGGDPAVRLLRVSNRGCAPSVLAVDRIWSGNPAFPVEGDGFTLSAGESRDVQVSFAPLSAVEYFTRLTVESDDPDAPAVSISLFGVGVYWGQGGEGGDPATGVPDVPGGLALHAVPNPFNPVTEIRCRLPRAGRAVVRLYDLRGALVRELDGGERAAGPLTLVWRGRDRRGREAPSGTYMARLLLDGRPLGPPGRLTLVR